jgi:hypothetical protein
MTDPLEALAARAEREPFFLASVLTSYVRGEQCDEAELVAALGCRREDLLMLKLCRAPRCDGLGFREDVDCICERFGLDPERLASVVKRGRVIARLTEVHQSGQEALEESFLMAAREREQS